MLTLSNISKTFGGRKILEEVSLQFEPGQVYTVSGTNGSGKTTLLNLISGFVVPDSGRIQLDGCRLNLLPPFKRASLGIGRMFQRSRGFDRLSALDNLLVSAKKQPGNNPLRLGWEAQEEENRLTALDYLESMALLSRSSAWLRDLSLGERKIIDYGRLLMTKPRVLLLDEPFAGIGENLRPRLEESILGKRNQGLLIILVEHETEIAGRLADRELRLENAHITELSCLEGVICGPF